MISSKLFKSAAAGLVCLVGGSGAFAQFKTDQAFWQQPHIQNAFATSYSVLPKTEPKPTEEEQLIIKEVITALGEDNSDAGKAAALNKVLAGITGDSSGALEFTAGNLYAEKGDLTNAIKYYDAAAKKHSGFLRAVRNSSVMKVREGKFEAAIEGLIEAINLGARDSVSFGLLGLCFVNTGRDFSAETAYREAIVLDPEQKDWQIGLAKSLMQQAKYNEAIAVLEQVLVDDPENDLLWGVVANAYLGKGDAETAVAIQEIVDRLGKATPESLIFMGNIYLSRELSDLAMTYFQRAIAKEPNQEPEVYVSIAETLTNQANFDKASQIIADIESSFGDKLNAEETLKLLRLRAQIGVATNQGAKVIPILEELIKRDPLDAQALILLADYYTEQENIDDDSRADLYYERATKVEEWEVRALVAWARSLVSRKQYSEAIPKLEEAQILRPRDFVGRYLDQVRAANRAQ